VVLGSSGEAPLMDEDESEQAIGAAREAVPRGRLLIAGTGRESTRASVRASRRAAELGADAVLVRTPGFFKSHMTADVFVRHYTAVADASPVPVLLYNFTAVTGVNLPVEAAARLAEHPNIAGMKESGGDVAHIADLAAAGSTRFVVLAGSASTFYAALCSGAIGGILALAVLVPDACVRLFELTRAGQHDAARALQRQLVPLARLIGPKYGIPGLKAALGMSGCDVGRPRPPLAPAPESAVAALKEALARLEEIAA
jgi:4-hydroxy-2-oxoglutarate aldolase